VPHDQDAIADVIVVRNPSETTINMYSFTRALSQCLQAVMWLEGQLLQLALPGKQTKAAAAQALLQEQQQQLQEELTAVVQRCNGVLAVARAVDEQQNAHAEQQQATSSGMQVPLQFDDIIQDLFDITAEEKPVAGTASVAAAHSADAEPAAAAEQEGTSWQAWVLPESVVGVVGQQLPQQLQAFGEALWSLLPQPHCCCNWACVNLAGVSELRLAGKASRCSRCKVAR
jgi:hypothetical protein